MNKFDEIMSRLIAICAVGTGFGFIVWAGVLLMLWVQRLVLP
jgi:hypothetical protein